MAGAVDTAKQAASGVKNAVSSAFKSKWILAAGAVFLCGSLYLGAAAMQATALKAGFGAAAAGTTGAAAGTTAMTAAQTGTVLKAGFATGVPAMTAKVIGGVKAIGGTVASLIP
jgi:hypothetical protein